MSPVELAAAMQRAAAVLEAHICEDSGSRAKAMARDVSMLRIGALSVRDATTEGVDPGDVPGTYMITLPWP